MRRMRVRMPTIADRYCASRRIAPTCFARHALFRALPLQGQLLYPLLCAIPGFLAPDLEFIRDVGRAHTLRHFAADAADFKIHPDNAGFARRVLKLRVSSRKLRRHLAASLEAETITAEPAQT